MKKYFDIFVDTPGKRVLKKVVCVVARIRRGTTSSGNPHVFHLLPLVEIYSVSAEKIMLT
jgi:hypothetical protein